MSIMLYSVYNSAKERPEIHESSIIRAKVLPCDSDQQGLCLDRRPSKNLPQKQSALYTESEIPILTSLLGNIVFKN